VLRIRTKIVLLVVGVVLLVAVVVGVVGDRMVSRGFSARDQPSAIETAVARAMRRLAVPRRSKSLANPVYSSDEILAEARAHFADHCAVCHANDGSGDTTIGRNLYPRVPDMRLDATQSLTDGELYATIQDGIRLTGMPAWGKAGDDNDEDSWKLVHLIRHLKDLTPEQLKDMKRMNPKSLEEFEEERQDEEFLRGGAEPADEPQKQDQRPHHKHQ
jgi:mono/diheme cytochrome c family protein